MAERLRKMHQDDVRTKIQTSQLINRLQNHALGELEMEPSQIKAAEVLIRKTLPDLMAMKAELGGPDGGPIEHLHNASEQIKELFGGR